MEDAVVQVIESSIDLTPVLKSMEVLQGQLDTIEAAVFVLCGVVLGVMVVYVLAVMFR